MKYYVEDITNQRVEVEAIVNKLEEILVQQSYFAKKDQTMAYRVRLLWLYPWWLLWGFWRWVRYADGLNWAGWYWDDGRHTSWHPIGCTSCRWRGPRRWAKHGYRGESWSEDVEQQDLCPKCGGEVW